MQRRFWHLLPPPIQFGLLCRVVRVPAPRLRPEFLGVEVLASSNWLRTQLVEGLLKERALVIHDLILVPPASGKPPTRTASLVPFTVKRRSLRRPWRALKFFVIDFSASTHAPNSARVTRASDCTVYVRL